MHQPYLPGLAPHETTGKPSIGRYSVSLLGDDRNYYDEPKSCVWFGVGVREVRQDWISRGYVVGDVKELRLV